MKGMLQQEMSRAVTTKKKPRLSKLTTTVTTLSAIPGTTRTALSRQPSIYKATSTTPSTTTTITTTNTPPTITTTLSINQIQTE